MLLWLLTTFFVFVYRGNVPCKCRDLPRLPWFSLTAEARRINTVIESNRAMMYRISMLCRRQARQAWKKTTMTFDFNFEAGFGLLSVSRFMPTLFHLPTLTIARHGVGSQ